MVTAIKEEISVLIKQCQNLIIEEKRHNRYGIY